MLKSVIGVCTACVMSSIAAVAVFGSSPSQASSVNPYAPRYERNIAGMGVPDQTLDTVLPPNAELTAAGFSTPVQSKTCSSTCSKSCSTTCTTTRGCKVQTQGCQGSSSVPTVPTATAKPTPTTKPATLLSSTGTATATMTPNLTARTVVNAQRALVIAGYQGLCVTGDESSPEYRAALLDFQNRKGLNTSGEVTDATWALLQALLVKASR